MSRLSSLRCWHRDLPTSTLPYVIYVQIVLTKMLAQGFANFNTAMLYMSRLSSLRCWQRDLPTSTLPYVIYVQIVLTKMLAEGFAYFNTAICYICTFASLIIEVATLLLYNTQVLFVKCSSFYVGCCLRYNFCLNI